LVNSDLVGIQASLYDRLLRGGGLGIRGTIGFIAARLVTASVVAPAAAHAGNPDLCKASKACIYADDDFSALIDSPRDAGGGVRNVNAGDDNRMDSWENRTSTKSAWYHNANGGGDCVNMNATSEDDDINVFDSDELSSWRTNLGPSVRAAGGGTRERESAF
jgi:hypothetical protein